MSKMKVKLQKRNGQSIKKKQKQEKGVYLLKPEVKLLVICINNNLHQGHTVCN